MEPENYKFGGGPTETVLHPLVLAALIVVTTIIIFLPHRYRLAAFVFGTFLIPAGQEVFVLGIHVYAYRIIVLAAVVGMMRSRQKPALAGGWNSVDTWFSLAVIFHGIAFSLLYSQTAAVVNQGGFVWDNLGGYMFLRYAIRSKEDVTKTIKYFAVLATIFAVCMICEQLTGENVFGVLGGVRLVSEVREGHIRAQAAFQHAILAGTFGAMLVPLFVSLWQRGQAKRMGVIGAVSATTMTLLTACSTPVLAHVASIVGICFWPFRRYMRWVRWGIIVGLLGLNMVMRAPVWYVVAHVSLFSASSANHRADLLDTFVRHVGDWWLLGTPANSAWGYEMFDTSNQYVHQGVTGGLSSLVFFIAIFVSAFGRIGRAMKAVRGVDRRSEWLLWLLGSALFANVIAFFGISYFDQTRVALFALLAMISAATATSGSGSAAQAPEKQVVMSLPATDSVVLV